MLKQLKQKQTTLLSELRVAWLFPSLQGGNYWHPVLKKFAQYYKNLKVYTAQWSGYSPGFENGFVVEVVGGIKTLKISSTKGYERNLTLLSPEIIIHLLQFRPDVVFVNGFSLWTLLSLLLKPIYNWQVVIAYEGSAPNIDCQDSKFRTLTRRFMIKLADALITNSQAGKLYLTDVLGAQSSLVFSRPYEVPFAEALLQQDQDSDLDHLKFFQKPIFLFCGQLVPRKGLKYLLEACTILKAWGRNDYTLLIIGEGEQRKELEAFSKLEELPVQWKGWVDYSSLGAYFKQTDVFVLPTLEDTWGMVVLEAMAFGKPILCSKKAGASEMIVEGENGYLFEPEDTQGLAKAMCSLMDNSELVSVMGHRSGDLIAQHTPKAAAQFLANVTSFVHHSSCEIVNMNERNDF